MMLTRMPPTLRLPLFIMFGWLSVSSVKAQSDWLTVVGLQDDPSIDIVQVQLGARAAGSDLQAIKLRVNRAATRTSTDGVVFRSFIANAVIDCAAKSGRFTSSAFYALPLWQGQAHKTFAFSATDVRPMLFRSIEPNPTERIIRAACMSLHRANG
jgi:hypothetical protein